MTFDLFRFTRRHRFDPQMDFASLPHEELPGLGRIEPAPFVQSLMNGPATVYVDDTGLTVLNGALTIKDEFGSTVMVASGFSGNWSDFMGTGLYNGIFAAGTAGAMAAGRTTALPYWTVTLNNPSGTATFSRTADTNYPGGVSLRFVPGGATDFLQVVSDMVGVIGLEQYSVDLIGARDATGSSFAAGIIIDWYDAAGAFLSSGTSSNYTVGTSLTAPTISVDKAASVAPAAARFAKVRIKINELISHSANSKFYLGGASLRVEPVGRGSAFPLAPVAGQHFVRTDLSEMEFIWSQTGFGGGSGWLSAQLFTTQLRFITSTNNQSWTVTTANAQLGPAPDLQGGTDIYIVRHHAQIIVNGGGTALGALHKWVGTVLKNPASGAGTTIATVNIDSGASAVWRTFDTNVAALMNNGTPFFWFGTTWTKTGTPGSLQALEEITYRIVAT